MSAPGSNHAPPPASSVSSSSSSSCSSRYTNSSYYSLDGQPSDKNDRNSQSWVYAREVRKQQAQAPLHPPPRGYPSEFKNIEKLPLFSSGTDASPAKDASSSQNPPQEKLIHQPIIPGQEEPYKKRRKNTPGAIRTIYREGDCNTYSVVFHDERVRTTSDTSGFSMAVYYRSKSDSSKSSSSKSNSSKSSSSKSNSSKSSSSKSGSSK